MSHSPIPPDICWEIALLSAPSVIAHLALLSSTSLSTIRPLLYRDIYVEDSSDRLAPSSARGPPSSRTQPELRQLASLGDFFSSAPHQDRLPVLRSVKARAEDVGKFARIHPLEHVWLWAGAPTGRRSIGTRDLERFSVSPARLQTIRLGANQLLMLLESAPAILVTLRAVVLDEDATWYAFTFEAHGMLTASVAALNERTPLLESLRLVCSLAPGKITPPVDVHRAPIFATALLQMRSAPLLKMFHFCGVDGCGIWYDWGGAGEHISYSNRAEHTTGDWAPRLGIFPAILPPIITTFFNRMESDEHTPPVFCSCCLNVAPIYCCRTILRPVYHKPVCEASAPLDPALKHHLLGALRPPSRNMAHSCHTTVTTPFVRQQLRRRSQPVGEESSKRLAAYLESDWEAVWQNSTADIAEWSKTWIWPPTFPRVIDAAPAGYRYCSYANAVWLVSVANETYRTYIGERDKITVMDGVIEILKKPLATPIGWDAGSQEKIWCDTVQPSIGHGREAAAALAIWRNTITALDAELEARPHYPGREIIHVVVLINGNQGREVVWLFLPLPSPGFPSPLSSGAVLVYESSPTSKHRMLKRKKAVDRVVNRAGPSTQPSEPTVTTKILREKTRVLRDGTIRQDRSVVSVPAGAEPPTAKLRPDVRRPREPVYDAYDAGEGENVDSDDEVEVYENRMIHCASGGRPFAHFLAEMLRREGRGDHRDYPGCALLCADCIVSYHRQLPLHRIEHWTGTRFLRKTLKTMGLRIQLGHCMDLIVVALCLRQQLATTLLSEGPRRCIIAWGTVAGDNNKLRGRQPPSPFSTATTYSPSNQNARHTSFTRVSLGRRIIQSTRLPRIDTTSSEDDEGMATRADAEACCVRSQRQRDCVLRRRVRARCCAPRAHSRGRTCRRDGRMRPEEKQFLHALFLAMDANFRLKRKDVSTEEKDPGLGKGWAFFCEVKAYMAHVVANWDQKQERSHCVAHDAVDKPDREARGTASSGIGAVDCARHNMKRPNAVGDLQLGERYLNMDYMFFRSVAGTELMRFFVSYDIACQWHIHIWQRMVGYQNETLTIDGAGKFMTFLVPKFHLPAHIEACNLRFSFNLTRDVGQTDGEAPERGWANANPLARSTKEMGPGSRRDTLDDHFNDWNHKKIIALGYALRRKTQTAVPEMVKTERALADMNESVGSEGVKDWTEMAVKWERDPDAPNPFETLRKDTHLAKVRSELATEAAARETAGNEDAGAVRDDMHITELLSMGLQLEDQQCDSTSPLPVCIQRNNQRRMMVERTAKLRRKIFAWIDVQAKFFPELVRVRELEDDTRRHTAGTQPVPGIKVSDLTLWLPSAIAASPGGGSDMSSCKTEIMEHEYRLRVGQANEALHEVRRLLLVRTHLYKLKDTHSRGVRANTRSADKIAALNDRIRRAAAQYRAARATLETLGRELKEEDVRGLPRSHFGDPLRQAGKKARKAGQSRTKKARKHDPKDNEALTEDPEEQPYESSGPKRAHGVSRWCEEVDLLEEDGPSPPVYGLACGLLEGETAYALGQAALQEELAEAFAKDWQQDHRLPAMIRRGRAGELAEEDGSEVDEGEGEGEGEGDEAGSDEEEEEIALLPQRPVKATYVDEVLT
ncbi:hypothetical protein DFH09DRAFT_1344088 [Mycena vulgaris]|nr:hypothetical protein DFH09DRAFT_1344088 [Mycena vulgaris]